MNARMKRADQGISLSRALMLGGAIILIVVLGYRQFSRMMDERVSVWVSGAPLQAGQSVAASSVASGLSMGDLLACTPFSGMRVRPSGRSSSLANTRSRREIGRAHV